jgi:HSP20 family protein
MSLIARNPLYLINGLQRDLNRAFEARLYSPGQSGTATGKPDWSPTVDIHENADGYHLSVDLPGITPEQIEVTADKGVLSIRGSRAAVNEDKELKRSERIFGSFRREFSLPDDADLDRIEARSSHGVLTVFVPKTAKVEPKRITVQ